MRIRGERLSKRMLRVPPGGDIKWGITVVIVYREYVVSDAEFAAAAAAFAAAFAAAVGVGRGC